jgi:hypothetical protein
LAKPGLSSDRTRQVLTLLREKFDQAGHGSMTRVERQLGLGRNFFSNTFRRRRASFDVGIWLATLEALGIEWVDFLLELDDPERVPRVRTGELKTIARKHGGGH